MPVHSVSVTSNSITICKASNDCTTLDIVGFIGPDDQAKADSMAVFIQEEFLDTRQKLNTIPNDDPDRTTDPARADLFWDGPGSPGQTDLVGRSVEITITWTGSLPYVVELQRL